MRVARVEKQAGFTYLGVLIAVVLIGAALATLGTVWSTQSRREREVELLYRGNAIRKAIGAYVTHGNGGIRYPMELQDLVLDQRWPQVRRYLRRVYEDPMTGAADWTLIRSPDGGIMGVASRSKDAPFKRAGFDGADLAFNDAECYCDWQFIYQPSTRWYRPANAGTTTTPIAPSPVAPSSPP